MSEDDAAESAIAATRDRILKEYADGSMGVAIIIDPKDKQRFMKLLPDPGLRIAFVRLVEEHEKPRIAVQSDQAARDKGKDMAPAKSSRAKGPYGQQAKVLRLHIDWMGNPKVWAAFGSDDDYLEWCRHQLCAHCKCIRDGQPSEAAHVRRIANGAGTGIKPPFSAIPLCHDHHLLQHTHGESALGGRDWFDKQRIAHVQEWLWQRMKQLFCIESMRQLPPEDLYAYAEQAGLIEFLPDCYKEGAP